MIASIGAIGYSDYPTYIRSHGLDYANKRRRLYKIRQNTDRTVMNTNGYGADRLFWWLWYCLQSRNMFFRKFIGEFNIKGYNKITDIVITFEPHFSQCFLKRGFNNCWISVIQQANIIAIQLIYIKQHTALWFFERDCYYENKIQTDSIESVTSSYINDDSNVTDREIISLECLRSQNSVKISEVSGVGLFPKSWGRYRETVF